MRPIDAEALEEDLFEIHEIKGMNSRDRELIAHCISHVRQQPTTADYDMEKVVERLNIEAMLEDCPVYEGDKKSDCYIRVSKAIEIVRKGGAE